MRPFTILSLLCAALSPISGAAIESTRPAQNFFPRADLMKVGVYYYPEQWPREQWQRDLQNIAKLGFDFTHYAEFSWTFLEPEEGKFDFRWLDEAVELASKAGLKVILGTPTPAPPAWMGEKYPEIYLVGADGRRREHGIRANNSLSNPRFLAFSDRIVTALAKRYGKDPRVLGWQIDNEPDSPEDYSPSARKAFQTWLRARYGTIQKLNEIWVGSFWSTRYSSFEQVLIPNTVLNAEDKLSPHAVLDFQRFTAETQAAFVNRQAEILKKQIRPEQWVTSNFINATRSSDPRRADRLDFPTFTLYAVRGKPELGVNGFRQGAPYRMAEASDYFRSIKGVTGVMELQPGQVNWASTNPQVEPGAVHMWIMHAFGGGNSFVCTYRYRHPLRGSEMYHDGIVETDGLTLSRGGREFVQAIQELKALRAQFDPTTTVPERVTRRKTAFLWSHDVLWDLEIQKQTESWNTWRHRNTYTAAIKSTGAPVDFVSEADDFSAYPFLVAPAYQLVSQNLLRKWKAYAEKGGHLILTARTGQKDQNGHFSEGKWASPMSSLIGAELEFFDMLLPDGTAKVRAKEASFEWNTWGDVLSPATGTEVLATYADQFYAGKAAAITRRLGKGSVTYIGVETKDGKLERDLVRGVYQRAGVAIEDLPTGVYVEWRDGFLVGVNYSNEAVTLSLPRDSRILVGENPLRPAQAIVWKEGAEKTASR